MGIVGCRALVRRLPWRDGTTNAANERLCLKCEWQTVRELVRTPAKPADARTATVPAILARSLATGPALDGPCRSRWLERAHRKCVGCVLSCLVDAASR